MGAAAVTPVVALLAPHPHPHYTFRHPNLHSPRQFSATSRVSVRASYQDDEFNRDYDEQELGFGNRSQKQRKWWSDDPSTPWWDSEDEDDDDEDDDFEGLGAFSSIFKVFQAFGWVVPAIVVSLFLGTGSNAFLMALALPLAQSAISSVFDLMWDRATPADKGKPKSKPRRRKRYSSEASSSSEMQEEREQNAQSVKSSGGDYKSWVSTGNVKGEGRARSFGGWDELDDQRRKEKEAKIAAMKEKTWQSRGKLSRGGRRRRTPLLVRLLVALFPFLGFWTKLF